MAEIPSYLAPNSTSEVPAAPQAPAATDLSDGGPAEQVWDVANKVPLNIPYSEFEIAVRSGQYAPVADKEYVVKDRDGVTHRVDGKNLKTVFDQGSTFAAPEEAHKHMIQHKYGNQEVLAGVEGAMRGFLPGISDRLLMLDPSNTKEELAGRAEANPISAGLGEAVGTIASPVGKLAMAKGALTAAKATTALTKVATKAGLSNKVAKAIVTKIAPAAAGSAVEGAFFGAAHLLNEDALGNAQFNAENLLASVEQGALWGAAFGGGLSALGSASSAAAKAAAESRAGKYLSEKSSKIGDYVNNKQKATYEFLGITPAKARKLAERDPEFIDDALKWTGEVLEQNPRAGIAEVATKVKSDLDDIGSKISTIYDDVDKVVATNKTFKPISQQDLKFKIAQEVEEKVLAELDGIEGAGARAKSLNKTINEILESSANAKGEISAKESHEIMRRLDKQIFDEEGLLKSKSMETKVWRVQRDVLRKEIDTLVQQAEKANPQLQGQFDTLKQYNRRYRTISSLRKAVDARAFGEANESILKGAVNMTSVGATVIDPTLGAVTVVAKKFLESDMLRKMQILGKIEKAQLKTKAVMQSSLKALGSGTRSTEPLVAQSLVASAVATELVEGKRTKPKDEQQAYRNIAKNAQFAAENPEQFLQGVNRYSAHLYAVAPKTSGALDTAALNAMVFLHTKSKKTTKAKGFFDAKKMEKVNGAEILKMQQRMDMISNPSKAFKLLEKGKLGATHVETIKAVYPAMYAEMQKETLEFLSSEKASKLTYSQKLNVSMLMDIQADESTHYTSVLGLQANFETAPADDNGVVNPTQGGLAKVDKASRMDLDDTDEA